MTSLQQNLFILDEVLASLWFSTLLSHSLKQNRQHVNLLHEKNAKAVFTKLPGGGLMLTYKKSELGVKLSAKSQQNFTQTQSGEQKPILGREGWLTHSFSPSAGYSEQLVSQPASLHFPRRLGNWLFVN